MIWIVLKRKAHRQVNMYSRKLAFPMVFILILATTIAASSKIQHTAGVNSKFLDPHLTEEENLDYLSGTVNVTKDVNRDARNAAERKLSSVKTFGFFSPMFGMLSHMSSPMSSNSYSSQYNIPGSTQVSSQGYTVPLYNYPFYNYFFRRGQGRTHN